MQTEGADDTNTYPQRCERHAHYRQRTQVTREAVITEKVSGCSLHTGNASHPQTIDFRLKTATHTDITTRTMNIGIITFHFSWFNYGAVLQTYAVSEAVRKAGHTPYVIDFRQGNPSRAALRHGAGFDEFRHEFLPGILPPTQTREALLSLNDRLDGFLAGGDQIWRYGYVIRNYRTYFLDFAADDKLKISYAPSFGIDRWEGDAEATVTVRRLLHRMDSVSVREESGVKICRDIFGIDAVHVLDPTLLHDAETYMPIIRSSQFYGNGRNAVAYMILDDNNSIRRAVEERFRNESEICDIKGTDLLSKYHVRNIVSAAKRLSGKLPGHRISRKAEAAIELLEGNTFVYRKVPDWLCLLHDSRLVVTDSFHAVVFSIIFRRDFLCVANPGRGKARLESLLGSLGITDRLCNADELPEKLHSAGHIGYDAVYARLAPLRKRSFEYLCGALDGKTKGDTR